MYLAIAAVLASGTKGVEDKLELTLRDCTKDPAQLSEEEQKVLGISKTLPKDLPTALQHLGDDKELVELMTEGIVNRYIAVKKGEMEFLSGMSEADKRRWIMERY